MVASQWMDACSGLVREFCKIVWPTLSRILARMEEDSFEQSDDGRSHWYFWERASCLSTPIVLHH